jgi:hypothetical protein
MQEIKGVRQESKGQNSDKLFEVAWAKDKEEVKA